MLRWIEQSGSKRIAAAILGIVTISAAAPATSSASDPILYAPGETSIQYVESVGGVYTAPFPEGQRLYGLRNFKPPGKNIYEPPPIYQPPGLFPGPFGPYYGFYGPGFYGRYGGYYYGAY